MKRTTSVLALVAGSFLLSSLAMAAVKLDGIKCPVSGKDVKEENAVDFGGGKVYLCCGGCPDAFKKDTGDVRETPSMFVVRDLLLEQAQIHVYDPQVKREDMWAEMDYTCDLNASTYSGLEAAVTTSPDAYAACDGAHALAVLTAS